MSLLAGEGEKVWKEQNYSTARKPGPLKIIQYPLDPKEVAGTDFLLGKLILLGEKKNSTNYFF